MLYMVKLNLGIGLEPLGVQRQRRRPSHPDDQNQVHCHTSLIYIKPSLFMREARENTNG